MLDSSWLADGNRFWYASGPRENTVVYLYDPIRQSKTPFFDTARLRKSLGKVIGREPPYSGLPFTQFEYLEDQSIVRFNFDGLQYQCNLQSYDVSIAPSASAAEIARREQLKPQPLPFFIGSGVEELLSPDQNFFAGVKDYNVYLRNTDDGKISYLTQDGREAYPWDIWNASPAWSPNGQKLAISRVDLQHMDSMPVVNWLTDEETVDFVPWFKAGRPLWKTELSLLDVTLGKRVTIDAGSRDNVFISGIDWLPDSSELIFARIDREFKWADILAADSVSGSVRKLFTETQTNQLNLSAFGRIEAPLLDNGAQLLWLSERSGTNQLYLYSTSGKLIRQLTSGNRPITELKHVDDRRGYVYYMALGDELSPYSSHLYRVSIHGGEPLRLTEASGQRIVRLSPSGNFFLDSHSSLSRGPITELRTTTGRRIATLSETNMQSIQKMLPLSMPEEFTAKAADGITDLHGVIIKPHNFDPNLKYPIVDHIYNAPHSRYQPLSLPELLSNPETALAQLGMVMLMFDGRGSTGRGKKFQDASYGRLGEVELADHLAVLEQLASERPWMDLTRVGIFGISYGGHMTLKAMFEHPDIYSVGVASAPLVDLAHGMAYTEHYMGLPEANPEGYRAGANTTKVGALSGNLLVIHATKDVNAPFSSSIKLIDALISAGKRFDLMLLPNQPHVPYGKSEKYWLKLKHQYLQKHLLNKRTSASLP